MDSWPNQFRSPNSWPNQAVENVQTDFIDFLLLCAVHGAEAQKFDFHDTDLKASDYLLKFEYETFFIINETTYLKYFLQFKRQDGLSLLVVYGSLCSYKKQVTLVWCSW